MRFSQLRYFIAVCRCGSLTRAAAEFSSSQPALTKAIRTLEEELEVELFRRAGKKLLLTPEGQIFLEQASRFWPRRTGSPGTCRIWAAGETW